MNSKISLKPCPFCGGGVRLKIGFMGLHFFSCKRCGAMMSFNNDICNGKPALALLNYNSRYYEIEKGEK